MLFEKILKEINCLNGNYRSPTSIVEAIYIAPENMKELTRLLEYCDDIEGMLITPYLINTTNYALYELHYYEFSLDICNVVSSYYIEYNVNNTLPKEIVERIKPRAVIAKGDRCFYLNALQNYLSSMDGMSFEEDRNAYEVLKTASLFYQIF